MTTLELSLTVALSVVWALGGYTVYLACVALKFMRRGIFSFIIATIVWPAVAFYSLLADNNPRRP